MIFITGDIHGSIDIHKLASHNFTMQKKLTREDYLIICGDFGLVWDDSRDDKYWRKWLDNKSWTTLWIDGNHENFDLLKEYPVEDWHGGKIHKITDNIFHLCRGYIFEIDGRKIFAFGGAESHDKEYRKLGSSLWLDELPNEEEIKRGRKSLDDVKWNVDIVITHSLSSHIQDNLFRGLEYNNNILTDFLSEIDSKLNYDMWFSGHYHLDMQYDEKHFLIYDDIVKLTENGFECVYPDCKHSDDIYKLPDVFEVNKR